MAMFSEIADRAMLWADRPETAVERAEDRLMLAAPYSEAEASS